MNRRRFVMLDRDGTIIVAHPYLSDVRRVELIPGAASGMRQLSEAGFGLVVITNQSAVNRGFLDLVRLEQIHWRMRTLLDQEGVHLDGIYFCPHTPEDDCYCRKPRTGLVERAAKDLDFDPRAGFLIGDNTCDVELGRHLGATTFLVRTGYGSQAAVEAPVAPDYVAADLCAAARIIRRLPVARETHVYA